MLGVVGAGRAKATKRPVGWGPLGFVGGKALGYLAASIPPQCAVGGVRLWLAGAPSD